MPLRLVLAALAALPIGWLCALVAARLDRRAAALPKVGVFAAALILFAWSAAVVELPWLLAATLMLASGLLILASVDVTALRLPDAVTLPLLAAGLLLSLRLPDHAPLAHLAGAAAGYGLLAAVAWLYHRLRGREGVGLGDAKLLAAGGAWLGWTALPYVLLLACLGGLAWVMVKAARRGWSAAAEDLPFGAPLCLAIWVTWLYGAPG